MELATDKVEQFLGLMLDENGKPLSKEFRDHVFAEQQKLRKEGKDVLIGDLAIKLSHEEDKDDKWPRVTEQNKNDALRTQAVLFATAAEVDIDVITSKEAGNNKAAVKSRPFWNTNAGADTSVEAGAVNAGHMARSMVLLSHDKPELAESLKPAVQDAATLAKTLAEPKLLKDLDEKEFKKLKASALEGLKDAAIANKTVIKGGDGKEMSIDKYIEQMDQSMTETYKNGKLQASARGAVEGMDTPVRGGEEYETAAATVPGGRGQIRR